MAVFNNWFNKFYKFNYQFLETGTFLSTSLGLFCESKRTDYQQFPMVQPLDHQNQ